MTDQTPRTEAGRMLADWMRSFGAKPRPGITADESILAIEAEAAAQARTEALDRFRAAHDGVCGCPGDGTDRDCYWPGQAGR